MTRGPKILPSPLAPAKALPYRVIELPWTRGGRGGMKLPHVEDVLADLYAQGYRIIGCGEWFLILELRDG